MNIQTELKKIVKCEINIKCLIHEISTTSDPIKIESYKSQILREVDKITNTIDEIESIKSNKH